MRIAVTAEGPGLESPVAINFARCSYFIAVDVDDFTFEAVANPGAAAGGGAGPEAAKLVADLGVKAVVTGLVGPNAFFALQKAGVQVFVASGGSVRAAVTGYRAAHLPPLLAPNAQPHAPFIGHGAAHSAIGPTRPAGKRRRQAPTRGGSDADEQVDRLRASLQAVEAELAALREQVRGIADRN